MNTNIQFIQTTPEKLVELINEGIKKHLDNYKASLQTNDSEILMTRLQACEFLQIDSSTLWHWTNKGKIISYGIAGRKYYKKNELLACLIPSTRKKQI